jgi:hypothetical protein
METLTSEELKQRDKFIRLLGVDRIQHIESNNWISYDVNKNNIDFITTDNKNDDVIFFTICYDENNKLWFSNNCIDHPPIAYDSYTKMRNHVKSIEDKMIDNDFDLPDLP